MHNTSTKNSCFQYIKWVLTSYNNVVMVALDKVEMSILSEEVNGRGVSRRWWWGGPQNHIKVRVIILLLEYMVLE